jgi:anti-sigma-K factor RskA
MTDPRRPRDLTHDEVLELGAAFVLGALDDDEATAVRAHLATCELSHDELAELASLLPALAASAPAVEPPAGLGARIRAAAAADLAAGATPTAAATATVTPQPTEPTAFPTAAERTRRGERRRPIGRWLVGIAAVLAIALLGGWNLLLQGQLDGARAYQQSVEEVLAVAAQPGSLVAVLRPDPAVSPTGGPSGLAAVDSAGKLSLAMQSLAPTSGHEVYEAWVIGGDGVPVPLGSFVVGQNGTASFEGSGLPATNGIVLALTREPGPGATTPTLPIVSSGVARSPSASTTTS